MTAVARLVGVSTASVSRWANSKSRPDSATCAALAQALDLRPEIVLAQAGHRQIDDDHEGRLLTEIHALEQSRLSAAAELAHAIAAIEQLRAELATLYHAQAERDRVQRIEQWSQRLVQRLWLDRPRSYGDAIRTAQALLVEAETTGALTWRPSIRRFVDVKVEPTS